MIAIEDALATLLADVTAIQECESVPVMDAHHRVLAHAQQSPINVPPADVSAMDGYAVTLRQIRVGEYYPISQRIPAGYPAEPLQPNSVARIFTGSVIPPGADTVIIQEDADVKGDRVKFLEIPRDTTNIRCRGQDIIAGKEILPVDRRLLAQDLGLLASIGVKEVSCRRRLRVGVFSSGDELVEPGTPLTAGKIYNSNRFTLKGLINSLAMDYIDLGHIKDNLNATIAALSTAHAKVDVIITTGGVSVGEEDHIKQAVQSMGKLHLWKLAIKPGKPLAYGKIKQTPFFGLPGNPVAVFVTFLMVVRPYLLKMQGDNDGSIDPISMPADFNIDKASPRQEYRRVRMQNGSITEYHSQDSSVMTSTHWANALAVVPAHTTVAKGDYLQVFPFSLFSL